MDTEFVTVPADEVARAVNRISAALTGIKDSTTLMALLGLALLIQRPGLSTDKVIKGISDVSQWIAFYLDTLDGIPKEKLN